MTSLRGSAALLLALAAAALLLLPSAGAETAARGGGGSSRGDSSSRTSSGDRPSEDRSFKSRNGAVTSGDPSAESNRAVGRLFNDTDPNIGAFFDADALVLPDAAQLQTTGVQGAATVRITMKRADFFNDARGTFHVEARNGKNDDSRAERGVGDPPAVCPTSSPVPTVCDTEQDTDSACWQLELAGFDIAGHTATATYQLVNCCDYDGSNPDTDMQTIALEIPDCLSCSQCGGCDRPNYRVTVKYINDNPYAAEPTLETCCGQTRKPCCKNDQTTCQEYSDILPEIGGVDCKLEDSCCLADEQDPLTDKQYLWVNLDTDATGNSLACAGLRDYRIEIETQFSGITTVEQTYAYRTKGGECGMDSYCGLDCSCGHCTCSCAGDPHLKTFNNFRLNYQGIGETALCQNPRALGGAFKLHTCMTPIQKYNAHTDARYTTGVTIQTAAAFQKGDATVLVSTPQAPDVEGQDFVGPETNMCAVDLQMGAGELEPLTFQGASAADAPNAFNHKKWKALATNSDGTVISLRHVNNHMAGKPGYVKLKATAADGTVVEQVTFKCRMASASCLTQVVDPTTGATAKKCTQGVVDVFKKFPQNTIATNYGADNVAGLLGHPFSDSPYSTLDGSEVDVDAMCTPGSLAQGTNVLECIDLVWTMNFVIGDESQRIIPRHMCQSYNEQGEYCARYWKGMETPTGCPIPCAAIGGTETTSALNEVACEFDYDDGVTEISGSTPAPSVDEQEAGRMTARNTQRIGGRRLFEEASDSTMINLAEPGLPTCGTDFATSAERYANWLEVLKGVFKSGVEETVQSCCDGEPEEGVPSVPAAQCEALKAALVVEETPCAGAADDDACCAARAGNAASDACCLNDLCEEMYSTVVDSAYDGLSDAVVDCAVPDELPSGATPEEVCAACVRVGEVASGQATLGTAVVAADDRALEIFDSFEACGAAEC